ncbi:MAG: hypothetical protein IKJ01_08915 [Lachnospiraceae bacterium]|nr:hypothetical protein [Lachnospiraceae bacterium]
MTNIWGFFLHTTYVSLVAILLLQSAFVCGVFSPVLVIPYGVDLDEKVILHELLHLRYKDATQSMIWCMLRSLHWCNPF